MNVVNSVKSLNAFGPWLEYNSLSIFQVTISVNGDCNKNTNDKYTKCLNEYINK